MIKNFIKRELFFFSKYEVISLIIILFIIAYNSIILKDSLIACISAICGLTYTFIAGKGKIICYLFGLIGSGFYGYLAYTSGLYGNFLLYTMYYIPMQIIGIISWRKHIDRTKNEIYRTSLKKTERIITYSIGIILSLFLSLILKYMNDTHPYIDGASTIFSILGMYLTVRRCIEQWLIWGFVNLLGIVMWISVILSGVKVYSTLFMWIAYFIMAIYFYLEWRKNIEC